MGFWQDFVQFEYFLALSWWLWWGGSSSLVVYYSPLLGPSRNLYYSPLVPRDRAYVGFLIQSPGK